MRSYYFLAIALLVTNKAFAMEPFEKLVKLSIGGYEIKTTRQTILESGILYFASLVKGAFKIEIVEDSIFVDRPRDEGHLLDNFLRTKKLPSWVKLDTARNAASFFGIPLMEAQISKREKAQKRRKENKITKKMEWGFSYTSSSLYPEEPGPWCLLCQSILRKQISLVEHLINDHEAEIISLTWNSDRAYRNWEVFFKYPKPPKK
jgi:hypothetical protein